jgi:hypothetical protein
MHVLIASAAAVVCTWLITPLDVPLAYNCVTQYCARQEFWGSGRLVPVFAVYLIVGSQEWVINAFCIAEGQTHSQSST